MGVDQNGPGEEAPKQSWIQIKAAAIAERKSNGGEPSQKSKLLQKKKTSVHPKKPSEPSKDMKVDLKVPKDEEANQMDKTEAPSDPEGAAPIGG
jgi:hypothetical protein